jgi:WNK lysine deficient protein kinase
MAIESSQQPSQLLPASLASSGGNLPERLEEIIPAIPVKDYRDDQPIDDLINDTATATNRGPDKAAEWLVRLHAQDVMTVGDLRDLHDEDWANLGLTVFASRALRNALHGKSLGRPTATTAAVAGGVGTGVASGNGSAAIVGGATSTLVSPKASAVAGGLKSTISSTPVSSGDEQIATAADIGGNGNINNG